MNKALTVKDKVNNVRDLMIANQETMFAALPNHITPDKMIRIACSSMVKNPKLLECSQPSLINAIMELAALGLVPDGMLGHAHLVPFGKTVTAMAGYRGLVQLCRQSGGISSFYAHVVRADDDFSFTLGTAKAIIHNPSEEPHDGTYTHAYAVAHYKDGGYDFDVWSFAEIEKHKKQYSKGHAKADSPWNTAPEEMAKKTVIRRLVKMLPVSSDVQRIAAREDRFLGGIGDTFDGVAANKRVARVELPDFSAQPPEAPGNADEPAVDAPTTAADDFERDVPPTQGSLLDGQSGDMP